MLKIAIYVLCFFLLNMCQSIYVITDFGAIPHEDHRGAHIANAKAFINAVIKANST